MTYQLDARQMGRAQVHDYLRCHLPLPEWYGDNLDALYDCLTEAEDMTLLLCNVAEAPDSFPAVRRVLEDAGEINPDLTVLFQDW